MRLIDASELIQVMCVNMDSGEQFDKATHCVDVMPTVDAVPVIRCKDCVHWDCYDSETYCGEHGIFNTDMNSYCSYAKRKEHE